MFPQGTESISSLDVTMTPTMYVLGMVVALAVEFIKAMISRWPFVTPEIRKPLMPLLSIGLSSLVFGLAGVEGWLVAGVLIGLAAGGGYDMFRATSGLKPNGPLAEIAKPEFDRFGLPR
jgi:hypothetical protein